MTLFDLGADASDPSLARGLDAPGDERVAAGRRRVLLVLAYDGAGFHGFAPQPGRRTVGGALVDALEQVCGHAVEIACAGRTDAGVHALAQVAHADLDATVLSERFAADESGDGELGRLARSLDRQLGPQIACLRARLAPDGFHARFSAVARRYRYDLDVADAADPRRRTTTWRPDGPVDLSLLRLSSDPLLGEHDFAAFCRRPPKHEGALVRRVTEARWLAPDEATLRFEIEANAFCHQMVRSIVGVLVACGQGRLRPSEVLALLRSGERSGHPQPAPAEGLCLVAVRYPSELGGTFGEAPPPPPLTSALSGAR